MQRWASDSECERLLVAWANESAPPWCDGACRECMADFIDKPMVRGDWLCLWHRARKLRAVLAQQGDEP